MSYLNLLIPSETYTLKQKFNAMEKEISLQQLKEKLTKRQEEFTQKWDMINEKIERNGGPITINPSGSRSVINGNEMR